jgi:cytochrome b6-f complex iron-sulfur subunit
MAARLLASVLARPPTVSAFMTLNQEDDLQLHTRRQFCVGACRVASVAALGGLAGTIISSCGGSPTSPGGDLGSSLPVVNATRTGGVLTVTIDTASPLANVGSMALVQASGSAFLVARIAQDSFNALSAICTHQTCTITGFSNELFICPCHGSEFDPTGRVVRGPATLALHQYPTQFTGGVLTITG